MTDLSYRSEKTEVRTSPIHGKGLFARAAIGRGEIVAVKGGHVLPKAAWESLEPTLGPAEIQLAEELFIAPVGARPLQREQLVETQVGDVGERLAGRVHARCYRLGRGPV
jgi:hypothetical protein